MVTTNKWFEVDKEGLARVLQRRGGKAFVVFELLQNAWDQKVRRVSVNLTPCPNRPLAELTVEDDDPEGFAKLAHAFTLFAESEKKGNPRQRGRFNLGEKLVLACCESASIATTTGTIYFEGNGYRKLSRKKTQTGSKVVAMVRMTRPEYEEVCQAVTRLIPPPGVETEFNGRQLTRRSCLVQFNERLKTDLSDKDGNLRRVERKTVVKVYEPQENEIASLYELGIPVMETGDKFHIDVLQKVPLNLERDNVPPSYLRRLRTAVLNRTSEMLSTDDATSPWVREAAENSECCKEACAKVITQRFGPKRTIYDPSDPEANNRATSEGYTVIRGGSLSAGEWANVKKYDLAKPSGQVTPSPKPYDLDGEPLRSIEPSAWTDNMKAVAAFAQRLASKLLGVQDLSVQIVHEASWPFAATYGCDGPLVLNLRALSSGFFECFPSNLDRVLELFLHEFGHHFSPDHLDAKYHKALARLGGKAVQLALEDPSVFI